MSLRDFGGVASLMKGQVKAHLGSKFHMLTLACHLNHDPRADGLQVGNDEVVKVIESTSKLS